MTPLDSSQAPLFHPYPYQRSAIDFMKSHPFCALFLDMGLGKTAITLQALLELNEPTHVLVVAPKAVATSTWPAEVDKWRFPFSVVNCVGLGPTGREAALNMLLERDRACLAIANRELVPKLIDYYAKKRHTWPFGTVILDESQSFKNSKAKRTKALMAIRPSVKRLVELSGTPAPNGLEDLWSQIYLLDMGWRLETKYQAFLGRYFRAVRYHPQTHRPIKWKPEDFAEQEIEDRIKDIAVSMKNDVVELPDLVVNVVDIQLPKKVAKTYESLEADYVAELFPKGEDGSVIIEAQNAAALTARLRQLASGTTYLNRGPNADPDEDADAFETVHEEKLRALERICRDTASPVLACYHFHSSRDSLLAYFDGAEHKDPDEPRATWRRPKATLFDTKHPDHAKEQIEAWNRGEIELLLIYPGSAGFGLNLQEGGHTLVWYDLDWSLEHYQQATARLHRIGQTSTVVMHQLVVAGTIDERVQEALSEKGLTQESLLASVKMESPGFEINPTVMASSIVMRHLGDSGKSN